MHRPIYSSIVVGKGEENIISVGWQGEENIIPVGWQGEENIIPVGGDLGVPPSRRQTP